MEAVKDLAFIDNDLDYSSPLTYVALITFLFCWLMFARNWSQLPVGRTAAALLGGSIMVTTNVITPQMAFASVSGGTMLLLVGLMIILAKLEEKGVTQPLKTLLLMGNPNPRQFLARVSISSAILGAFIMNDGAAIFLTTVVMEIVEEHGLLVEPFALAVATSANIGSAATVLGNPKNMLVQEKVPGLDFVTFAKRMAPPSVVCTFLNTIFLIVYYWSDLDDKPIKNIQITPSGNMDELELDEDDDVRAMQAEYLAAKGGNEINEFPPLSYLVNMDEQTPLREQNNTPFYCDQFTETPIKNVPSTFDSYTSANKFFTPVNTNFDALSQHESIMSPARSFIDLDDFELGPIPKYRWPKVPRPQAEGHLDTIQSYFSYPHSTFHPHEPNFLELSPNLNRLSGIQQPKKSYTAYIKPVLMTVTLLLMYVGFILKLDLGWTCLTAAMFLLFIDANDASTIISERINWSLLCYLFGVFSLLRGVSRTPLPTQAWKLFSPLINPTTPNISIATLAFATLVIGLSFAFTSIPTVLLVSPYIPTLTDPQFARNAWFLLAWSVTLCGNLTAFGSVAGLIVSEICKDYSIDETNTTNVRRKRPNRWVGEFSVWTGFTWWSTTILLILGAFYITLEW